MGRMSVRRQGVNDAPRPLRATYVTGNYFTTLGVNAVAGRVFTAADDAAAAAPVVVLAYHAWQGVYGGDASIVGSTLVVEGQAFTVAGVTPPGFFGETLQGRSARHVGAAAAGTADRRRRRRRCCASRSRRGCA